MTPATMTPDHEIAAAPPRVLEALGKEDRELYRRIPAYIDYVPNPAFEDPSTEDELFGDGAQPIDIPAWTDFPEVDEDAQPRRKRKAVLSGPEERRLFLSYNYARYRLANLMHAQHKHPTAGRGREMVRWYRRVLDCRALLVRANLALVVAMGKRTRIPNVDFAEMISEGNMALLRSVEKFDVARGFKFSTYACRAILKSFNRLATKTGRYRQHFPAEYDPEMERSDYDVNKDVMQQEESVDALREVLSYNRAALSDLEQTVVSERFALGSRRKRATLAEVGRRVGLTNERVRQIQKHALGKLRDALDAEYLPT